VTNISQAPNSGEALSHWAEGAKYVREGGRSLILINGAAAIGILTFIGNNHQQPYTLISALTWFAWGALAGVALFVFAYVAQLHYGNRALGVEHANCVALAAHRLGYIATAFSIVFFVLGMHAAAHGFSEQFLGSKAEVQAELTAKAGPALLAVMTPGRWINIAAATLGALGTISLVLNSWSLEPRGVGFLAGGPTYEKDTADLNARNAARLRWQRVGLVLILASFVMQAAAQFFD
jgi:hypothetical protein